MRISDWSSDVCSSDLPAPLRADLDRPASIFARRQMRIGQRRRRLEQHALAVDVCAEALGARVGERRLPADRNSVLSGKSVSVCVDIGGRRRLKKQKTTTCLMSYTVRNTMMHE